MFLEIKDFLKPEEVVRLQELAAKAQFVDGRISNPHNQAKNNLQAHETDPHQAESSRIVAAAFAHRQFYHRGQRLGQNLWHPGGVARRDTLR